MLKISLIPFGKEIKKKLIDLEQSQEWLIAQVKEKTGLYFDSSYLFKIMSGKKKSPKIIAAITEVLGISYIEE